ncbi:hypothetical protein BO79DRAFT_5329 [Aspergillus costaricaensis CBS 115574]|uniref:Uncharacterized protein n=1 Tax=Aspergillus costaricaensis CBS 115574 TaxID=1448317 RepID=A0ACD1IW95_9EURO|nr:hypothetical protein BO79DRAFT_5329 [Aspergillus costaricaensis CBS 115574]RAK94762.1 hypothetical protein BO79DRAFT_5329 [Aspergillus costaricaensis CBS 115574]
MSVSSCALLSMTSTIICLYYHFPLIHALPRRLCRILSSIGSIFAFTVRSRFLHYTPLLLLHATSPTYPCALDTAASLFTLRLLGLFTFLKTLDTIGRRNASNVLFFCALYSTWCSGLYFSPPLDHYLVNNGVVQSGSVRRRI